jgi:hypothetical protein
MAVKGKSLSMKLSASNFVFVCVIAIGIVALLIAVYSRPVKKSSAAMTTLATRSYTTTVVLGQPNLKETMFNRVVANRGFLTEGVHIDSLGRIYIFDSGNNRILGFTQMGNGTTNADIVIGQPSLYERSTANGDNTTYALPTASTLSLIPYPQVPSPLEAPRQEQMATDADGSLYVVDLNNNRVLKYLDPFTTDSVADEVWGQPDMITRQSHCGQSGFPVNNTGFCTEYVTQFGGTDQVFGSAVEIDPDGNLWVADTGNNRVLRFSKVGNVISKTADLVLGQSSMTTKNARECTSTVLTSMRHPLALKFHPVTGALYVEQGERPGEQGVYIYTSPFTTGQVPLKEIGRANFQLTAPADTTGWSEQCGGWAQDASGLHWARGMVFNPANPGQLFLNDGGNNRVLILDSDTGAIIGTPFQESTTSTVCWGSFVDAYGATANLCNPAGEPAFDSSGNLYIASGDEGAIHRFAVPLTKNGNNLNVSNGSLLYKGRNAITGKTFNPPFGLDRYIDTNNAANNQLYSVEINRVLVFNNPSALTDFATADYVVGQSTLDDVEPYAGVFAAITLNDIAVGKESTTNKSYMWVSAGSRIFAFPLPITQTALSTVPTKVIYTGDIVQRNLFWKDNNGYVSFTSTGLVFDESTNSLWISDNQNNRILRVKDPLAAHATVDLVLGQPNKTSVCDNACLGAPNSKGIGNPWTLALDKLGNMYVTDSGYEGWQGGTNNRVLRFNAAYLTPNLLLPDPIFPFPSASGVYGKPNFTSDPNSGHSSSHTPLTPVSVTFNSQNEMFLLADSYGNLQYERSYMYASNHTSQTAPTPAAIVPIPFGQAAESFFYGDDNTLFVQDLTWQRIQKVALAFTPTPTPTVTVTASPTPTSTPMPDTLKRVYFTFGKLRYGRYASSSQLRYGDYIYLKNYDPKKIKLLAISLYDYTLARNQGYTRTWRSSTHMYMRTNYYLPNKRKYAFIFTFQDIATSAVIKKYFVVNNISSTTITL